MGSDLEPCQLGHENLLTARTMYMIVPPLELYAVGTLCRVLGCQVCIHKRRKST